MANIRLSKSHDKSNEEVEELVCKLEEELCQRFDLSARRSGNRVELTRSGVDAALTIAEQRVDIDIELGMMASMFAPKLESVIKRKLDEYLG